MALGLMPTIVNGTSLTTYLPQVCPWNFAELKPANLKGVADGMAQISARAAQGYPGPGQLYLWEGTNPKNVRIYPNPQKSMF